MTTPRTLMGSRNSTGARNPMDSETPSARSLSMPQETSQ